MRRGRAAPSATVLEDGRVLIAGGDADDPAVATTVDLFDPRSGSFSAAPPMHDGRQSQGAALLRDGRVFVALGLARSAEVFDPSARTWTRVATFPRGTLKPSVAVLDDGRVFVGGGDLAYRGTLSKETFVWDPSTSSLRVEPNGPREWMGDPFVLADGRVLVSNPYVDNFADSLSVYDAKARRWALDTEHGTMWLRPFPKQDLWDPRTRTEHLVAGRDGRPRSPLTYTTAEGVHVYDEKRGAWDEVQRFIKRRKDHAAALLADGRLFVVGGSTDKEPTAEICPLSR